MAAIEHMGLGLAAKRFVPQVHLAVLMVATEVIDILWAAFAVTGVESLSSSPWSHSLLMAVVWSLLAGVAASLVYESRRAGTLIGLLVFSHWVVDFITHPMLAIMPADTGLPLYPGSTTLVGLGVYSTLPGVIAFWVLLVVPGAVLYALHRRSRARPTPAV